MIVVFGSINLDLIFRLDALPAPGETRLAQDFRSEPGGKGANQAVAAARDGAAVAFYGAVGRDAFAEEAMAGLRVAGVDLEGVESVAAKTGVASIVTDCDGRNAIAVAPGANFLARQAAIPDAALRPGAIVLLQMECDPGETVALIERAHRLGAKIVLNLAPAAALPPDMLQKVALLAVNEQEAAFLGAQLGVAAGAAALAGRLGIGVVRTLGAEGCEACRRAIDRTARSCRRRRRYDGGGRLLCRRDGRGARSWFGHEERARARRGRRGARVFARRQPVEFA
jgi:ribokinase